MYDSNRIYEIISQNPDQFSRVVEILFMFFITFLTRCTTLWDAVLEMFMPRGLTCTRKHFAPTLEPELPVHFGTCNPVLAHVTAATLCVTLASIILLNVLLAIIVAAWDEVNTDKDEEVMLAALRFKFKL